MNTQLKLLLEEMIKNKVPAEVNGIETKVALWRCRKQDSIMASNLLINMKFTPLK